MARNTFPNDADRLVVEVYENNFVPQTGQPISVYTDAAGAVPATDLLDKNGAAVAYNGLSVDENSCIPDFQGPATGATVLYLTVGDSAPAAVTCVGASGGGGGGTTPWATPPAAWAASTDYTATAPASVVTNGGECYVCSTSHTSASTFDSSKWIKIAAKGTNGTNGTNGANGATIYSGTGAPADTLGANGDFYLQLDTSTTPLTAVVIGPKASGSWPTGGVDLVGPGVSEDTATSIANAAAGAVQQYITDTLDVEDAVIVNDSASGTVVVSLANVYDLTDPDNPVLTTQGAYNIRLKLTADTELDFSNVPTDRRSLVFVQVTQAVSGGPFNFVFGTPAVAPSNNDPVTGAAWSSTNLASTAVGETDEFMLVGLGTGKLRLVDHDRYPRVGSGTVPSSPTAPTATSTVAGQIDLSWAVPSDGGSAITKVQIKQTAGGTLTRNMNVASGNSAPTSTSITGLVAGTSTTWEVQFVNANGVSGWSADSTPVTVASSTTGTNLKTPPQGLGPRSGRATSAEIPGQPFTFTIQAKDIWPDPAVQPDFSLITSQISAAKAASPSRRFVLRIFTSGSSVGGYSPSGTNFDAAGHEFIATGTHNTGDPGWAKDLGAPAGTPRFTLYDQTKDQQEDPNTHGSPSNTISYTSYEIARYWTLAYQQLYFAPLANLISKSGSVTVQTPVGSKTYTGLGADSEDTIAAVDIVLGACVFAEPMLKHQSGIENHSGAGQDTQYEWPKNSGTMVNFTVISGWPSSGECHNHNITEWYRALNDSASITTHGITEPDWTFGGDGAGSGGTGYTADERLWQADFASPRGDGAFKAFCSIMRGAFARSLVIMSFNPYNNIKKGTYNFANKTGTPATASSNPYALAVMSYFADVAANGGLGLQAMLYQKSATSGALQNSAIYAAIEALGNPAGVQSQVGADSIDTFDYAVGNPTTGQQTNGHNFNYYELGDGGTTTKAQRTAYNTVAQNNPTVESTRPGYGAASVTNVLSTNQSEFLADVSTGFSATTGGTIARDTSPPSGVRGNAGKVTSDSSGGAIAVPTKGGTGGFTCTPGATVSAEVSIRATDTARSSKVAIEFFGTGGTLLSTETIQGTSSTSSTSAWTRYTATGAVPSDALTCRVKGLVNATATGTVEHHEFAQFGLYFAALPAAFVPPSGG